MSADFQKVLVKDNRLDVTDVLKYAVVKGGQNVTAAQFAAVSQSTSQLTFNVQVPSEQTIIDRRVLLQSDITLTVVSNSGAAATAVNQGCKYGVNSALAPFPLHQLMSVASATINNNTVSLNVQDVLPAILRLLDKHDLACYNGTTPTYLDSYYSYSDSLYNLNNPNAGYYNAADSYQPPRGSIVPIGYTSSGQAASANTVVTETFTFRITEPLLVSPFIFGNPKSNAQGFYGVQNLNFVFNIGSANRVFRGLNAAQATARSATANSPAITTTDTAGSNFITSVTLSNVNNSRLLFTFLTPHPSDLMPAKNIVPYYELPRYITTQLAAINNTGATTVNGNSFIPAAKVTNVYSSQSLQLNQIPDKLIVMVRQQLATQNAGNTDSVLPISGISINFNNNSGILASATKEDLYRITKDNGSNLNWFEFSGLANELAGNVLASTTTAANFLSVPTCGSFLVLEFGKDIQLVEDFYAPGSLGNFNLQMNVTVENVLGYNLAASALELVIITMNSGVFVNERGTSSTYTGILTKADVLEASAQVAYTKGDVERLVGGGFLDMVKSAVQKIAPVARALAPVAKDLLAQSDNKYAKMGSQALGAMGFGASGGGMSAGGMAGGRKVNSRLM